MSDSEFEEPILIESSGEAIEDVEPPREVVQNLDDDQQHSSGAADQDDTVSEGGSSIEEAVAALNQIISGEQPMQQDSSDTEDDMDGFVFQYESSEEEGKESQAD